MVNLAEKPVSLLRAKREIREFRTEEQRAVELEYGIRNEVWLWYGGIVSDYEATFSGILVSLNLGSFRRFLADRANRGFSTNVLDLMGGDASFLRDLKCPVNKQGNPAPLEAGLCVTLADGRPTRLQALDQRLNIKVLCGDLTSKKTWALIDERQRELGIDAFDLIVCRGAGAVEEKMVPSALYPFLFSNIWRRLTDLDGLFLTQLPREVKHRDLLKQLRLIPGIKLDFQPVDPELPPWDESYYPSLGIIKTRTEPPS